MTLNQPQQFLQTTITPARMLLFYVVMLLAMPSTTWAFSTAPRGVMPSSLFIGPATRKQQQQPQYRSSSIPSFAAALPMSDDNANDNDDNDQLDTIDTTDIEQNNNSLRSYFRSVFGFSWTAFRGTLRGLTGISLSAVYVATLTVTGAWIRQMTKALLSLVPPPARYFLQPFLILYYAPLYALKSLASRQERGRRQQLRASWATAVTKAEEQISYWPIETEEEDDSNEGSGDATADYEI